MKYLIEMFYKDVFDFILEWKKGGRAYRYMERYHWSTSVYWDSKDPHATEENPHVQLLVSLGDDLPLELSKIFNMKATQMGYSVTPGKQYRLPKNLGSGTIDTYDISKDNKPVLTVSKFGRGSRHIFLATNIVNYYTDHELLLEARRTLNLPELVSDNAPLSQKALTELDEILEKAERELLREQ